MPTPLRLAALALALSAIAACQPIEPVPATGVSPAADEEMADEALEGVDTTDFEALTEG